jgi:hypothetical protein
MAPIITATELKAASGEFPNPLAPSPKDAYYSLAAESASALIRAYTGLKFEVDTEGFATERYFEYDGSGYLDIDECQAITAVTSTTGYLGSEVLGLTVDEWSSQPYNFPVTLWLRLSDNFYFRGISPEMGFRYNLDTLGYRVPSKPNIIGVTGVWGWPEIPADVRQAALWTALTIVDTPKPYNQESIADYSRTRGPEAATEAIPERAQVALLPYIIPRV